MRYASCYWLLTLAATLMHRQNVLTEFIRVRITKNGLYSYKIVLDLKTLKRTSVTVSHSFMVFLTVTHDSPITSSFANRRIISSLACEILMLMTMSEVQKISKFIRSNIHMFLVNKNIFHANKPRC
jgi:hypothetical protein